MDQAIVPRRTVNSDWVIITVPVPGTVITSASPLAVISSGRAMKFQSKRSKQPWILAKVFVANFLVLFGPLAQSATIQQIGTVELLEKSQLIVHAYVITSWTEVGPKDASVVTKVVLGINDVLKGDFEQPTMELTFLGGTLGPIRQHIAGSNIPVVGEEGIYFLEDPDRFLINPFFGWTQGHYRVRGEDRTLTTFEGRPVFALRSATAPSVIRFAHDAAAGIVTNPELPDMQPMSVDDFKLQLSKMMSEKK